jgi:phosphopantetheinyl transferase
MADVAYTNAETAYLVSLNDPADLRSAFYEFWTLKEAFAKALGMPLLDALGQCRFVDSSGARRAEVPTTQPWRATVFAPRPQLRLAVVRMAGDPDPAGKPLRTSEWPKKKADEWPVVLDLASHNGRDGDAC